MSSDVESNGQQSPDPPAESAQLPSVRSSGSSNAPPYELDNTTRLLLEENEGMIFQINKLTHDLSEARAKIAALRAAHVERGRELDIMREKLGDATVSVTDASGKVVNFKKECDRLTADNERLVSEYQRVCMELEKKTDDIRRDAGAQHNKATQRIMDLQVEQFNHEMAALVPTVEHIVNSLKRCVVAGDVGNERMLECAQKELHTMCRVVDSVRRLSVGEESRLQEVLAQVRKGERLGVPGDLAIVIRWMIAQAFEAGLQSAGGNLRALVTALGGSKEKDAVADVASGVNVRRMFRMLGK
uniref:Uncharacterized protein TCIL3000_11_13620 n=1 Tax=Trypanosoma congolense (strain IL3000) TaxID=1068625 RepID=G0V2I4_TRYCI|nr:unnamed protein product [Trypanosoma congolense IL3000]